MAKQKSAGLIMYNWFDGEFKIFLGKPGGPFWKNKDSWDFPKGHIEVGELELEAAKREFKEETGIAPPKNINDYTYLGFTSNKNKTVQLWAFKGDKNAKPVLNQKTEIEFPPKSGKLIEILEIEKCEWFDLDTAKVKLYKYHKPIIDKIKFLVETKILK